MNDHLADPDARSWEDLKRDLGFTAAEHEEITAGARRLIAEARDAAVRSASPPAHHSG